MIATAASPPTIGMGPTSFGSRFRLTLITADPALAAAADQAGIERIGLDLEHRGKAARQAGEDTRLSRHDWSDFMRVAPVLRRADLFVRLNPPHDETPAEVERALAAGARVLMLPFFHTAGEVSRFVGAVGGRAEVMVLIETAAAALRIRDVLAVPGIDELMLGFNDLRLEFGVRSHFEVMASPLVDALAAEVRRAGLRLSMGAVARPDDDGLPIAADLVYAQYPRLGATGAWIARSFFDRLPPGSAPAAVIASAVAAMRRQLDAWAAAPPERIERAREELAARARRLG